MNSVSSFFVSNKIIFIVAGVVLAVVLAIMIIKKLVAKNQRKKEVARAAADRVRDENLNSVILNSYADKSNQKEVYVPYDVDYGRGEAGKENKSNALRETSVKQTMLQLIETTELSTRKFVLNPAKKIRIGSDLQNNDISVLGEGIAPHQCEIFLVSDKVYIKNMSHGMRTVIRRKKEQAYVDEKGIRLLSGDVILLGKVTYEVMVVN